MTAKHTKQKYTEKQTRLGAKTIKGAFEEVRVDTQLAKRKARPFSELLSISPLERKEGTPIQEFVPFHNKRKRKMKNK